MKHGYAAPGYADWLPAVSLGFAAFIFVTTEMLPVGLLPDIAQSLGKSEASTGLLLTVYAWVVSITSLPLTLVSARFDRRSLVLALLALFALGNFLAGLSGSFAALLAARICIALCHAVFWSIATALVTRVAPPGNKAKALSIVVTGSSLAMVLGVPLGTLLGHHFGWRAAFGLVGGAALVVFAVMRALLPPLPSQNAGSLKNLPALFRRVELVRIYAITLLTVTGHFTAVTYFAPYMQQVGGFGPQSVAALLLVLGGAGIVGSVIGAKIAGLRPATALGGPLLVLALSLVLLALVQNGLAAAVCLCLAWGAAMTCAGLICQTRVLALAPEATDVAVSIYSGTFNIGIGGGALLGGQVFAHAGVGWVGYAGGIFALLALILVLIPLKANGR